MSNTKTTTDLITIAIPVYQRFTFFKEAIQSAINQTVRCKIMVVDNASDHDKFKDYVDELGDELVEYHRNEENQGMTGNWNRCIELPGTPWITILHDDDVLHPQYIESVLDVIHNYDDVGIMGVKSCVAENVPENFTDKINIKDSIIEISSKFFLYQNFTPPGIAFKKSLAEKVNGFKSRYHTVIDLDFSYKLSTITRSVLIKSNLAFYRVSEEQETASKFLELIDEAKNYRQGIMKKRKYNGFLNKLLFYKASQDLIDFYNNTYPNSNLENEKFGKILTTFPINKILDRIKYKNSFKNL